MAISLNKVGINLDRSERLLVNENWTTIENELEKAKGGSELAELAKLAADDAQAKADSIRQELNEVVVSGDSGPQAAQASVGADGTSYDGNLKARLDAEHNKVAAQLAEKVGGGVKLKPEEFSDEALALLTGDGTVNVLSIPQTGSVDFRTFSNDVSDILLKDFDKSVSAMQEGRNLLNQNELYRIENAEPFTAWIEGKNIFSGEYELAYIDTGNNIVAHESRRTTKEFFVAQDTSLTLSGAGVDRNLWVFYDNAGNVTSRKDARTVSVPVGAVSARCYYSSGVAGDVQIEIGTTATSYVSYVRKDLALDDYKSLLFNPQTAESLNVDSNVSLISYEEKSFLTENQIYGIRYDINSSVPAVERVEGSVGLSAAVSVDNVPVTNDFDDIYPWSDMKICNLKETAWGAKEIIYKGDAGFSFDGTNGNVMVEVPKHYTKRFREGNYEYVLISGTPKDGFKLDPAFIENGKELDKIYVGRYDAFVDKSNQIVESKSGVFPVHTTLDQFKTYLQSKTGYGVTDWRTLMMLQRLFLVEFATRDSQSVMGGYSRLVFFGKTENYAQISETSTNRIIVLKGYESEKFRVGLTAIVESSNTTVDRRTITAINDYSATELEIIFDGAPKNITAGVEQISNVPQPSGKTDYLNYPSGREAGGLMNTAFQYRGIENLWGNIWNWVEGIRTNNLVFEYNESMYDTNYKKLSFKAPVQNQIPGAESTVVYAKKMGIDNINPNIMLPIETGTDTAGFDYWCDGFYSYATGIYYPVSGGGWDHFERGGLFSWRFWFESNHLSLLEGGRLIYKPI